MATPTAKPKNNNSSHSKRRKNNPNELFVGNLSYFCEEQDLYDLFSNILTQRQLEFGQPVEVAVLTNTVSAVRIIYSDGQPRRSLMFGFVTLHSLKDANFCASRLQNVMFMGRKLKVQFSNIRGNKGNNSDDDEAGYQVHVAFQSAFPVDAIKRPSEVFLREILEPIGGLLDVAVKEYSTTESPTVKQEGYAFATFSTEQSAEIAIQSYSGLSKDGITIDCTWSHRSNHLKKAEYFFQVRAAAMGLPVPTSTSPNGSVVRQPGGSSDNSQKLSKNSSFDGTENAFAGLSLEPLKVSPRSISPLEQAHSLNSNGIASGSMSQFQQPLRSGISNNMLPDSLRPDALNMQFPTGTTVFDGLSMPSSSPSSYLTRESANGLLGSNSLSSHNIHSLYSGSYSNTSTPTSVRSTSRFEGTVSVPELNVPTVGQYRGPGAIAADNTMMTSANAPNTVGYYGYHQGLDKRSPMYAQQAHHQQQQQQRLQQLQYQQQQQLRNPRLTPRGQPGYVSGPVYGQETGIPYGTLSSQARAGNFDSMYQQQQHMKPMYSEQLVYNPHQQISSQQGHTTPTHYQSARLVGTQHANANAVYDSKASAMYQAQPQQSFNNMYGGLSDMPVPPNSYDAFDAATGYGRTMPRKM